MVGKKFFTIQNSRGDIGMEATFKRICDVYEIDYDANARKGFPQIHGKFTIRKTYPCVKIPNI